MCLYFANMWAGLCKFNVWWLSGSTPWPHSVSYCFIIHSVKSKVNFCSTDNLARVLLVVQYSRRLFWIFSRCICSLSACYHKLCNSDVSQIVTKMSPDITFLPKYSWGKLVPGEEPGISLNIFVKARQLTSQSTKRKVSFEDHGPEITGHTCYDIPLVKRDCMPAQLDERENDPPTPIKGMWDLESIT